MNMPTAWRTAALAALITGLAACGSQPAPRDEAQPAPRPTASPATAKARADARPMVGGFRFEAERAAEGAGCFGPNRERPVADRRSLADGIESYDVRCADRVIQVQCDMGMCRPAR